MKKHQLLEKAMRDYPAGTRFTFYGEKFEYSLESTGIFTCWKDGYNKEAHVDSIWRVNERGEPSGIVYDGLNKRWSEIVKPSLLSGKCAITVNNEREFKLLMEHYESKGWKHDCQTIKSGFPQTWFYRENNGYSLKERSLSLTEKLGYTIIPFSDFAAEVGITVPVFVMTSEDVVPLYVGDQCWIPQRNMQNELKGSSCEMSVIIGWKDYIGKAKFFSTKQAAEKWITEQNKPKEVEVKLYGKKTANIHVDLIRVFDGSNTMNLSPSDLEDMLNAYKSLQS